MSALWQTTAAVALAWALTLVTPTLAHAHEQVVRGQYLQLVSVMPDGADRLSPGVTVDWVVGVAAPGVEDGTISRTLHVDGDLAPHLRVAVASCTERPVHDCAGRSTVVASGRPTSLRGIDLGNQKTSQHWLLIRVTLPEGAPANAQALTSRLRLEARGAGDELTITPEPGAPGGPAEENGTDGASNAGEPPIDDPLPSRPDGMLPGTGVQPGLWLLVAAAALLGGAALRSLRPRSVRTDEADQADEADEVDQADQADERSRS